MIQRCFSMVMLILLFMTPFAHTVENNFVGVRACGVDNIGPLQDSDCISIDRWDVPRGYQTSPGDLYTYLLNRMDGVVAPAAHAHHVATEVMDGFLLNEDKIRIDSLPVTVKGEGALGSNVYTTLTAAGYTVASAQARWPYLTSNGALNGTHLIQSTGDLDSYDVNWCAMQAALYKNAKGLVFVNNGAYPIGRSLIVPSGTVLAGYSLNAVIYPHTVWTGDKRLIVLPTGSVETKVYGIKFNENPWPAMNSGQFCGVYVNSGSYRVRIAECSGNSLAKLVFVDKNSDQLKISGNACNDVAQEVWGSKGGTDDWHHMIIVDDNDFMHSYRSGYNYAVRFEDNAQVHYFRVTDNRVGYQALFYYYNVTTAGSGGGMFSEISRNRVIGNQQNNDAALIYWIGKTNYTSKIADNFLWNGLYQIEIGGQNGLSITGNTGIDSASHTRCQVNIKAPVTQVMVSGLTTQSTNEIATVCADYALAGTGNLSSATTVSYVNLAGNMVGIRSELKEIYLTTDYVKFLGMVDKLAIIATSRTLLPDEGVVNSYGANLTVTMCKSERLVIGKRVLFYNYSGTPLTIAGNGTGITKLDGSGVNSMTIAANSAAEFLLVTHNGTNVSWKQIR